MSDRDANEWATLLQHILDRPGWGATRLARESGVHKSTIYRWLKGDILNIRAESIKLVCDAAGVDLLEGLRAVASSIGATDTAARLQPDEGERLILAADASEPQKQMMLQRYRRKLADSRRTALEDLRAQIDLLGQQAS